MSGQRFTVDFSHHTCNAPSLAESDAIEGSFPGPMAEPLPCFFLER